MTTHPTDLFQIKTANQSSIDRFETDAGHLKSIMILNRYIRCLSSIERHLRCTDWLSHEWETSFHCHRDRVVSDRLSPLLPENGHQLNSQRSGNSLLYLRFAVRKGFRWTAEQWFALFFEKTDPLITRRVREKNLRHSEVEDHLALLITYTSHVE